MKKVKLTSFLAKTAFYLVRKTGFGNDQKLDALAGSMPE